LAVQPWLRDDMLIVAAPSLRLARGVCVGDLAGPVPMADLQSLMWLLREAGSGTRETADQALLPHMRAYPRSIELGSSEAIKHAAAAGLGVACLSTWVVAQDLQSRRLQRLDTGLPPIERQCFWVLHLQKQRTPALQDFIDLLEAVGAAHAPTATRG